MQHHLESPQIDRNSLESIWSPIYNDPLFVRWTSRRLGYRRRLSLLGSWFCCCASPLAFKWRHLAEEQQAPGSVSLLKTVFHLMAFILWLLIAGYLLTELTSTLYLYCPNSGEDWLLVLVLHLIGSYSLLRLYLLDSVLFLPVFAVPLLALLWSFDRRLTRVMTLDLTDEQLAHYSVFKNRMAALGTCKVALTLTSALLHVATALVLLILLLRGASWLWIYGKQMKSLRSSGASPDGRLFTVLWRKKAADDGQINF